MLDHLAMSDRVAGASPEAIASVQQQIGCVFPSSYQAFLALTNGYDGEVNGHAIVLWSTAQLALLAPGYDVLPAGGEQFLIGSNGGPTAYGIISGQYVSLPFVFAGPLDDELRVLGQDFAQFIAAIAAGEGW